MTNASVQDEASVGAQPSPDEVRAQMQRILADPTLQASPARRELLRFVVEETLAGRADRLKGFTIALAVFGRDDDFDPQTDPVVRVEARRLRRDLDSYYVAAGKRDPVVISIPKGGYVPTFKLREPPLPDRSAALPVGERAAAAVPLGNTRWPWPGLTGATLAIALAVVGATAWLWLARAPADQDVAQAVAAKLQLPGPAVVIAPFEDLTGTEPGRLLASGLTQELITNLLRFEDLRVFSASANDRWAEDPAGFSQQLKAGYEVKGSVVRAPDRIHLTVQLIEIGSGRYLWSEAYDRPLTTADVFTLQEELAADLAGRLAEPYGIVHKVSADLFNSRRPKTLAAYDCVLRTFAYRRTFSRELYGPSRDCLEDTVRRDPSYPDGWALLAFAHLDEYRWYGFGPLHGQPAVLDQAFAAAKRARDLAPDNVMSLSAYAAIQYYRGEFDEAESVQRRAVTLNPSNPETLAQLGWRLAFARDWNQGIGLVRQAAQQSMVDSGWYYLILAFDDYRSGDYRAALADMGRAGELGFSLGAATVAMSQAQLGNLKEAREALNRAITLDPTFARDPRGAYRLHHFPEDLIDQCMDGLYKAGLEDFPA